MIAPTRGDDRARWLTRVLGVVILGCALAVFATHWVTMVTLHADSDRLEYGFPLPAFRYGRSSGTWIADAIPLVLDYVVSIVCNDNYSCRPATTTFAGPRARPAAE